MELRALADAADVLEVRTKDGGACSPPSSSTTAVLSYRDCPMFRWPEAMAFRSWAAALCLVEQAAEWDGRSAVELLRTEWADEVVLQASEDGRSPLTARALNEERMNLARPIQDRLVELVADLPVTVAPRTLSISREIPVPYGVFAISSEAGPGNAGAMRFEIDGGMEATAQQLLSSIRETMTNVGGEHLSATAPPSTGAGLHF